MMWPARSTLNFHGLLGPYHKQYWILLFLHTLPTLWSLVTYLAAATVILGVAQSSSVLTTSAQAEGKAGFLTTLLAPYSPEQRLMIGICMASASVLLSTVTGLILNHYLMKFLDRFVVYIQRLCFENMLDYRMAYHDRTKRGDLTQLVNVETRNCRNVVKHSFTAFASAVTLVVYVVIILWISPVLTATFLGVASGAWLISRRLGKENGLVSEEALKERAATLSVVQEGLFGVRSIKSLLQAPAVLDRFEGHAALSNQLFSRSATLQYLQAATMELFGLISITSVMILSFKRPDLVTTTHALLFLYVAHRLLATVGSLIRARGLVQNNLPSLLEIVRFLDLSPAEKETAGTRTKAVLVEDRIVFDKVELAYEPGKPVLRSLDLEIKRGECLGIVGASGVGKSTLAHLLLRFYVPTSGRITLDGIPIEEFDLRCLRQHIGILSQDGFVFNTTIYENIRMGKPTASREEIEDAARRAYAHEFIEELPQGYQTVVGDRGVRLSGGQRQRLNIAQVFLKDPEILILDEATSALDSESEARVQEAIQNLSRNRTVLLIAHRLSTLKDVHRILVFENGGIVEQGRWEDLIRAQGRFAQAWEMQAGAMR